LSREDGGKIPISLYELAERHSGSTIMGSATVVEWREGVPA